MCYRKLVWLLVVACGGAVLGAAQNKEDAPEVSSRPTVLVTSATETDRSVSIAGAATNVSGVALGTGEANSSTYQHSEVWEVVRRLQDGCPAALFVTDPQTPHSLTVHVDYQKVNGVFAMGNVLYQLVVLDSAHNPLYVSKKNWLRREVKPVCKVIERHD
ncbi:MAG TPA: hypothetical protein VGT04_07070 [Acidobacteriaceae bacterium]|nr:hypothetical protein [Acidobacteriaceae bacterium]